MQLNNFHNIVMILMFIKFIIIFEKISPIYKHIVNPLKTPYFSPMLYFCFIFEEIINSNYTFKI